MESEFANISWLAVIVGAIAAFLVGWLWYSPMLFGKNWAKGSGVEMGTADEMPKFAMVSQFTALLLLSTVVGITASFEALITAILAILAAATFALSGGAFVKKSSYALKTDFGYIIVAGNVMILCQAIF